MEKFIVYLQFNMEDEDILVAEKRAKEIAKNWENKPDDLQITVRATNG